MSFFGKNVREFAVFLRRGFLAFAFLTSAIAVSADSLFPGRPGSDPWAHSPNDPGYAESWQLFSHVPPEHRGNLSDFEREHGSGMSVDKAWQFHIGTPKMLIAVFDSGMIWGREDLKDRHYINQGELPIPEGSTTYDSNGDGRFSPSDYTNDRRVTDRNSNGFVDPEDLILAFSDGVDSDGNGFVDDISGWDFHEHDNNPTDRTSFGHGTAEAVDSVAAINNAYKGAGICGDCSVVMMRLNDSFVVDSQSFARALILAADMGVKVVQAATGAINNSPYLEEAVKYAHERGVVMIGTAADENSFHHNYPATIDPMVYVNSIRFDSMKPDDANTFLNFNNCSNYGARVDVAAASISCSSEATAMLSGITALARSYSDSLQKPLSAGETISLIKTSALDINRGSNIDDPGRHSTWEGWDTITGYGRADAYMMLKRIGEGKIPPAGRITAPSWFDVFNGKTNRTIPVSISVPVPRSGVFSVQLEVARGVETTDSIFTTVASIGPVSSPIDGSIADVSVDLLRSLLAGRHNHARYENAFTFRLQIQDGAGQTSESRRTIFLIDDPLLVDGYPMKLNGSGESSGVFVDLDGDSKQEFVTADGGGYVHAFTANGIEKAGFPVGTAPSRYAPPVVSGFKMVHASIFAPIAVGDTDKNGTPDIVAVSTEGHISIVESDGRLRSGFPLAMPFPDMALASKEQAIAQGGLAAPVLADLDRDGNLEIIVAAMDGFVHVYRHDGKVQPGFPYAPLVDGKRARLVSSPAVYDLDGDGVLDLVFGTNHVISSAGMLFAISGRGNVEIQPVLKGFPALIPLVKPGLLPVIGTGLGMAPAIGDVDGDGVVEIVVHGFASKTYIVGIDGQLKRSLDMEPGKNSLAKDDLMLTAFAQPGLGDVNGDGVLDPVTLGAGRRILTSLAMGGKRIEFNHLIGAWNGATGAMFDNFPAVNDDMAISPAPVFADLDNDGKQDVLVGSGGYYVQGIADGRNVPGFPHFTGGWTLGSVSVGDMDGDGRIEVAATTREGNVFIWKTEGKVVANSSGGTFKGNPRRTGVWGGGSRE